MMPARHVVDIDAVFRGEANNRCGFAAQLGPHNYGSDTVFPVCSGSLGGRRRRPQPDNWAAAPNCQPPSCPTEERPDVSRPSRLLRETAVPDPRVGGEGHAPRAAQQAAAQQGRLAPGALPLPALPLLASRAEEAVLGGGCCDGCHGTPAIVPADPVSRRSPRRRSCPHWGVSADCRGLRLPALSPIGQRRRSGRRWLMREPGLSQGPPLIRLRGAGSRTSPRPAFFRPLALRAAPSGTPPARAASGWICEAR